MATSRSDDAHDARLARRVGEQRAVRRPLEELAEEGALWEALLAYREAAAPQQAADEEAARIWAGIAQATRPAGDRPPQQQARVHRLPTWGRRALAVAALLLAVVGAVWLLTRGPDAELVAAAETSITQYATGDGSVVTLRPNSQLYRLGEDRYRLEGEAYFVVTKQPEGHRFTVIGGDALVTVLGTRFNVATWGEEATVYLDEGLVMLAGRTTREAKVMEAGQQGVVSEAGVQVAYAPSRGALDWLRGELLFEGQTVRHVLDELEQHFGVRVDVPPELAPERITGRILLDDRDGALRDLGTVLGGRFVQGEDGRYRYEPHAGM